MWRTGLPWWLIGKESACNAEDLGSNPELGRSPGGRHGNPLQYSCLENPHGQRSLAGYSSWGHKELDINLQEWRDGETKHSMWRIWGKGGYREANCNRKEQIWLHIRSILLNLCLLLLCFKLRMLPIAWNTIQVSPFSWLWPLKVQHFSLDKIWDIKSCRIENSTSLLGGLQGHQWPDLLRQLRKDYHGKKFAKTNQIPSPFNIKEVWILTQVRWFFGMLIHHLLNLLAFKIKSLFLVLTTCLLIYWPVVQ